MVIKIFVAIFSFVLLFSISVVEAKVTVSPKKILHGLSITMIFSGKNIESDFEKLDKEPLKKNFEIYDVDGDADRIRLILYPRYAGELILPAMKYGQIDFASQVINVVENDEVKIKWNRPNKSVFINQAVTWQARVELANSANKVTLEQHPHANTSLTYNLQTEPYQVDASILGDAHHFAMSVEVGRAGKIKIRTPVVRVKNTSARAWLFFDETVYLSVSDLPSYLPVSTAVGSLKIMVDSLPMVVSTGELVSLNWQLSGNNVPIKFFPNLSQQLGFQSGIEWLSADKKATYHWQSQGRLSVLSVVQPFRANLAGWYSIPSLRLTYFDADSQQLKDVFSKRQRFIVVPFWLVWLANALIYSLVVSLALLFVAILWQVVLRVMLINRLRRAQSEKEIWLACLAWSAELFMTTNNISIGQWQSKIETHLGKSTALDKFVKEVNQKNYSAVSSPLSQAAIEWASQLPYFSFKLLVVLFIKWKNNFTIFIKRN